MARWVLGVLFAVVGAKEWQGPFNKTYSDSDCPNLGCKADYDLKQCESWCEQTSGCNAFNGGSSPGCCLRACSATSLLNPSDVHGVSYRLVNSPTPPTPPAPSPPVPPAPSPPVPPAPSPGFVTVPITIGNGVLSSARNSTFTPTTILEHNLSDSAAYGVMTHWWSTGEQVNADLVLDYWIDGESSPSVSFQLGMAAGQGWPRMTGDVGSDVDDDGQHLYHEGGWAPYGIYSAGGKMGKHGQAGAFMGYHNILFQKSIKVTARTLGGMQVIYVVVRGHEVPKMSQAAGGLVLPSGFTVPPNARMQLQRIDNDTFTRLQWVPLVELPKGYAGLMHLVTLAPETSPAGNSYIEGCWHLYPTSQKQWPGIIMGTGTEDFFDSSYYWCSLGGHQACLYAHDNSGLVHFSRVMPNGTDVTRLQRPYPNGSIERFSAYRFFDKEVVGFQDGGALQWRVGDDGAKCLGCPTGTDSQGKPCAAAYGEPSPVTVRSYAWMFTWPLDQSQGPAPSQEPVQCPNGQCPHFPNPHALQQPQNDIEVEERMKMLRELGPKASWQRFSYTV